MDLSRRIAALVTSLLLSTSAHAVAISGQGTGESTLQGRDLDGNTATIEAYYDTVQDITWLADADAAGFGKVWSEANAWTASLDFNGITGWRLPTLSPINGSSFNTSSSADGTTDRGYATTTTDGTDGGWRDTSGNPVSEMGHLFYVTLGNLGFCDPDLPYCSEQTGWDLLNTGPFTINKSEYWYDTEFDSGNAWSFFPEGGFQTHDAPKITGAGAWAVHSGDVGEVIATPLPAGFWLFGSGLLSLIGVARRLK